MMRFRRIFAVLAMLGLPAVVLVVAGNCPLGHQDTNQVSASGNGGVACEGRGNNIRDDDLQSGDEAAAITIDLSMSGLLGSNAALSTHGDAWIDAPDGAYLIEGTAETISQGNVNAANLTGAFASSNVDATDPTRGNGASHTFLIEDDGDAVTEQVVVLGTINVELTVDQTLGTGHAAAQLSGPGVSISVTLTRGAGGAVTAGGQVTYTDTNGQSHVESASTYFSGNTLSISLSTSAVLSEGDTFSVSYGATSDFQMYASQGVSGQASNTSMAGWGFSASAP